jgi:hypothetical protein
VIKAYCSAYFDTDTSGNKPPVISGISGPTILKPHQTGTWYIKASDPENDNLTYSITWGDEAPVVFGTAGADSARMPSFAQTSTFTHAYDAAGTYKITVVVRDTMGHEQRANITVGVIENTPSYMFPVSHSLSPVQP